MYNVVNSSCKIEKYHGIVSVCNSYVFYILINHKTAWVLVFFRKKCPNMRHRQKLLGHYSFLGLPFELPVPCYYIFYIFVNVKHKLYTLLYVFCKTRSGFIACHIARFTSGATPADHLMVSITAEPF